VLDAAQRAGLEVPFSCRKGVCGTCKGRIVSGETRAFAGDALSPAEARRVARRCSATPGRVRTWSSRRVRSARPIHSHGKTTTARVFRLQRLADDVMLVHLRFPAGIRVRFKPASTSIWSWTMANAATSQWPIRRARAMARSFIFATCRRRVHHLCVRETQAR